MSTMMIRNGLVMRCLCLLGTIHMVMARRTPTFGSRHPIGPREHFTRLGGLSFTLHDEPAKCEDVRLSGRDCHGGIVDLSIPSSWGIDHDSDGPAKRHSRHDADASPRVILAARVKKKPRRQQAVEEEPTQIDLALPLIPTQAWEDMTGDEFENPHAVQQLARSGLDMATRGDEWIDWRPTKDTERILKAGTTQAALDDGTVLVYIGRSKYEACRGADLPLIKTQSILPLSSQDMADLLMDSDRVQIYNKMSLGRTDLKQLDDRTKIVRNLTQPPMTKSPMVSVTLMHTQELSDGYLCVSRACPQADPESQDLPRNDILLGVNLLQDVGPDACLMTAVTHVYSPSLPKMLASKLGVTSAVNFVKDIRGACEPVAAQ